MIDFFSSDNINRYSRLALAQFLIFFLFLLSVISYSISLSDVVRPYFILMGIYFWSIYRPTLLSILYVFVLGLLFDFILNYPIGLHSLLFIIVQWAVRNQRLFFLGQPYMIVWLGFSFTCLAVMLAEWLFFTVMKGGGFDMTTVFYGLLISTFIFPLITLLFNLIYRILPPSPQSHLL